MSYTSPLGRLPVKKTAREQEQAIVPEYLCLPDGRRIPTNSLTNQTRDRVNINLQTRRQVRAKTQPVPTRPYKYTVEERIWQSQATADEIAARYSISLKQARGMTYASRYIIEKLDL